MTVEKHFAYFVPSKSPDKPKLRVLLRNYQRTNDKLVEGRMLSITEKIAK